MSRCLAMNYSGFQASCHITHRGPNPKGLGHIVIDVQIVGHVVHQTSCHLTSSCGGVLNRLSRATAKEHRRIKAASKKRMFQNQCQCFDASSRTIRSSSVKVISKLMVKNSNIYSDLSIN